MNLNRFICLAISASLFTGNAYAVTGESWEVTTKTDMPGMPAAMGETTVTICIQKGAEKDPKQLIQLESGCEITNLKTTGSKTTWKMRCDKNGDVMTGSGEVTNRADSFRGVTKLSGTSYGTAVNVTANYQGKRIGTACDTTTPPAVAVKGMENMNEMMGLASKQMASAMAEQCEVSNYKPADLVSNRFFGPAAACPGKEKFACKIISKHVSKNAAVYVKLARHDDTSDYSIAKACAIDMTATTASICKIVDSGNYQELAEYCPAEAKAFEPGRSGTTNTSTTSDSPVNSVIDGARKLKGLFGF
ncbi:MAG: DUF3617 family protein [Desulfuromonadaceae bacterium]|nr:DUF3617 family protein [Desulfuromonadaceae bacterium]